MIEDYAIAFEIQRARKQNSPCIKGGNRRAWRNGIIEPLMHALNSPVDRSPGTEDIGNGRIHGWTKLARPLPFWIGVAKDVLFDGFVVVNAFQLLPAGLGVSLRNGHGDAGVLRWPNCDL